MARYLAKHCTDDMQTVRQSSKLLAVSTLDGQTLFGGGERERETGRGGERGRGEGG